LIFATRIIVQQKKKDNGRENIVGTEINNLFKMMELEEE